MTFSSSGTINAVQAATSITSAACSAYVAGGPPYSITNYPASLEHGLNETFWPDSGVINQMNVIFNQTNYTYRI